MKKNELTYKEALDKLQKLIGQIEDPDRDPESLPDDVKKAQEMLNLCRKYLKGFEEQLDKLNGEQ